jgi:hypothetical protein
MYLVKALIYDENVRGCEIGTPNNSYLVKKEPNFPPVTHSFAPGHGPSRLTVMVSILELYWRRKAINRPELRE